LRHHAPRSEARFSAATREEYAQRYLDESRERYTALIQRTKAELDDYRAGREPEPPVIDYLIISGGGDFGAFGAGFLKGWRSIPKSDPLSRPRFDVITGVSTGALIAPFAYLDDAGSDDRILNLYRNPRPDWVKPRGPLYFLPYNISFATVPGLEREMKSYVTREMVARIADPANHGRLLFVNTTNLDDASPRVFYLVPEARRAAETGDLSRFQTILLASSGIPAAFPYREIDGSLYVDGAVSANMVFGGRLPEDRRIAGLWRRQYPGEPMPKLRYWVIFNNQLHAPPIVVRARWFAIVMRSIDVSSRAGSLNAIRQLYLLTEVARLKHQADVEMRFVAIPDDWRPPKPGTSCALREAGELLSPSS
jgi:Patatin-like phospholipase